MKRVAIAGCGGIANVHAWAISKLDDVRLIAVADTNTRKATAFSQTHTDTAAHVYYNITTMLANEDIDILHICTPHYLHVPMAIEGLKAGVDVFIEKPPAISLEQFNQLKEISNNSGNAVGFCFQNRYNETTRALDEIVANGSLGRVTGSRAFVTWRRDEDYYSDEWHGTLKKEGGGVLINQSIHTLDLMLRYLGTPVKIASSMSNHHLPGIIEVEDTIEAWLQFEDDKRACFYASNAYSGDAPVILELAFQKGRVTMIDKTITISEQGSEPRILNFTAEPEPGKSYWGNGHLACIRDFYSHITHGTSYNNNLAGVENTMLTTMKIYEKALYGQ